MLSFFVIFTLVLSSVHAYLLFKLRPLFTSPQARLLLMLFLMAMLGLLLLRSRRLHAVLPDFVPWISYIWLGLVVIAFGCFVAMDGLRLVIWLFKAVSGANVNFLLSPRVSAPIALIAAFVISGYAMYEARNVKVRHVNISTESSLGGVNRLRLVAVSDLHIGETIGAADVAKWTESIKELQPDILVVVGDVIDTDMSMRDAEARLLRSIPATYGSYAVLGNHEVYSGLKNSRDFISRAGMTLLENRAYNGGPINIVGINDPQVANFADGKQPDAVKILKSVNPNKFTLLLKHQPIFQEGEIGLFDLQISGHTHGGQIWPGRLIVKKIFGFSQGLNQMDSPARPSLLYLLNGTGYWGPPMRFLAQPEIVVFDIAPKQ